MLGDGEERCACAFDDFWREGWTPRWLLKGKANVYGQIAIALKGGAWREAGMAKLAKELGKGGGSRQAWAANPEEPGHSTNGLEREAARGRLSQSSAKVAPVLEPSTSTLVQQAEGASSTAEGARQRVPSA